MESRYDSSRLLSSLSSAPLTYLIPRQNVIPFAAPNRVSVKSEMVFIKEDALASLTETEVNAIVGQIDSSVMTELAQLKFKKPAFSVPSAKKASQQESPQMHILRSKMEATVGRVTASQHVKPNLKVKRVSLAVSEESESEVEETQPYEPPKRSAEEIKEQILKRQKVSTEPEESQVEEVADTAVEKAAEDLRVIVERLGLTDADVDISDHNFWHELGNGSHYVVTHTVLSAIQSLLERLNSKPQLFSLDVKYLLRIEKYVRDLLEGVQESGMWERIATSEEARDMLRDVCLACTIFLTIVDSGRSERQLFSSSIVELIVDTVASINENGVCGLFCAPDNKVDISKGTVLAVSGVVAALANLVRKQTSEESILARLEYLCFRVLFLETTHKTWEFEKFQTSCGDLLSAIFTANKSQRAYISGELALHFDMTPTTNSSARSFKASRGLSVCPFSILALKILTDPFTPSQFEFDDTFWAMYHGRCEPSKKSALRSTMERFRSHIREQIEERDETVQFFTESLINRMVGSSETTTRKLFEMFVIDLLEMVQFPEWPAAEIVLYHLTQGLMRVVSSGNHTSVIETFALEVIGHIGCTIVNLERFDYTKFSSTILEKISKGYLQSLAYLQSESESSSNAQSAYELICLNLLGFLDKIPESNKTKELMDIYLNTLSAGKLRTEDEELIDLDDEDPYAKVLGTGKLASLYGPFLALLLASFNNPKLKARTRAIKNLSMITKTQPAIINLPGVKEAIDRRVKDESPLVRDAVVDFIASYCRTNAAVAAKFTPQLAQIMSDDSVAVRKRVIKTCKELYTGTDNAIFKAIIVENLLYRKDDEESLITELALDSLMELLINPLIVLASETEDAFATSAEDTLEVVLLVLDRSQESFAYLRRFFMENMLHQGAKSRKVHARLVEVCSLLIDTAFGVVSGVSSSSKDLTRYMRFLSMMAECDGMLISQDYLVMLEPFLASSGPMCLYTLAIFDAVLRVNRHLRRHFAVKCESALLERLTKLRTEELDLAVSCIWHFSRIAKDSKRVASAAISCIRLIKPFADSALSGLVVISDPKLLRLLLLLGSFGTHCKFDQPDVKSYFLSAKLGIRDNDTVTGLILRVILCFCGPKANRQVRPVAVQGLLNICMSSPVYFKTSAVKETVSLAFQGTDTATKQVILTAFTTFLKQAERDALRKVGIDTNVSKMSKLDSTAFHGESQDFLIDGVCTSLAQDYLQEVLDICLGNEGSFELSAVGLLRLIMRLGLANPRVCLPTVLALESSADLTIREMALAIHRDLADKHESLIESSYTEGFRLAVAYRRKASQKFHSECAFLHSFFGAIGKNLGARRKAFVALGRSLAYNAAKYTNEKAASAYLDYVAYISRCFQSISFNTLEEAYIITGAINSTVCSQGYELLANLNTQPENGRLLVILRAFLALLSLNHFCMVGYGLSADIAGEFSFGKADKSLRTAPRARNGHAFIDLKDLDIECAHLHDNSLNERLKAKLESMLSAGETYDRYE